MSTAVKTRPLIAPKVSRRDGLQVLQQHIEIMDHLREVERRMVKLTPKREDYPGETFTTWHYANTRWNQRIDVIRGVYDDIERLAVAINLQAL